MKPTSARLLRHGMLMLAVAAILSSARAGERVGVYDSRVLAYACFNTPDHLAALRTRASEGKAARERGDRSRFQAIESEMKEEQRRSHLQVFSTAPVPEALEQLKDRIAVVQREQGIARLVSKWDEAALRHVPATDRVDVTEDLVRNLPLTDKQRAVAREIAKQEPLPLWKAKLLAAAGQL